MIKFGFSLINPFAKDCGYCQTFFYIDKKLSENHGFQVELMRSTMYQLIGFTVNLAWRGEHHPGPAIDIDILGFSLSVGFYDTRHWDFTKGTWHKYDAPSGVDTSCWDKEDEDE